MSKLNEYIGGLVADIVNARVLSDIQSVQVAKSYAKDDLLKHFSVPRMKIDEIEMNIPIAMNETTERVKRVYNPIDYTEINRITYQELLMSFGKEKLPSHVSRAIRKKIAMQSRDLEKEILEKDSLEPVIHFSKKITEETYTILKKNKQLSKEFDAQVIANRLSDRLMPSVEVMEEKLPMDYSIIVESSKLKEYKPENLIQVKLKISEDGMEWSTSENAQGEIVRQLLPE